MTDQEFEQRFPYKCQTRHAYAVVVPWCEEQFGAFNGRWALQLGRDPLDHYRFADEQAAILFRLRWS